MIYKICKACGSDEVRVPASAVWHAANEEWVLDPYVGVDEDDLANAFCDACSAPTTLINLHE